jgi:hypothetical protein
MNTNKARLANKISLVPLLLAGNSVSAATRQALRENRLKDAGVILMEEHGLSCVEAGHLLDVSVCDDPQAISRKPKRRSN